MDRIPKNSYSKILYKENRNQYQIIHTEFKFITRLRVNTSAYSINFNLIKSSNKHTTRNICCWGSKLEIPSHHIFKLLVMKSEVH